MWWRVRYYDGHLPLRVVTADDSRIDALARDGVIDITVIAPDATSMRLVGADHYYLSPGVPFQFGVVNDDGTAQYLQWRASTGYVECAQPPPDMCWFAGVTMPDDEARQIGLIR